MRMVPSPVWPLAGQSIFGQNTVCGSMTSSFPVLSTRNCHLIRTHFQVLAVRSPFSVHLRLIEVQAGLLTTIRFHDLRHSCATFLLAQGVPLVAVRDTLGH